MSYIPSSGSGSGMGEKQVLGYGNGTAGPYTIPDGSHIEVGRLPVYEGVDYTRVGDQVTFIGPDYPQSTEEIAFSAPTTLDEVSNTDTVDGYHATPTPGASKIPVAGVDGKIDDGWVNFPDPTPADESITTEKLAANAVTKITTVSLTPSSNISTTSYTFVDIPGLTMSVATNGGDLHIEMSGTNGQASNTSHSMVLAVNVNGTDYIVSAVRGGTTMHPWHGHTVVTGLPSGTYTVKGRFRSTDPSVTSIASGSLAPGVNGYVRLTCAEYKR